MMTTADDVHPDWKRVSVLGSGGMGTALAVLFARRGIAVRLWARDSDLARAMVETRRNPRHLESVELPFEVEPTSDARFAIEGSELLVVAIPSAYLRVTLTTLAPAVSDHLPATRASLRELRTQPSHDPAR